MVLSEQLNIAFNTYWHAGAGQSAGAYADALVLRDASDLPYVTGRHLKGLLRHALRRAEAWGWFANSSLPAGPADSHEVLLFGSASQQEGRHQTLPGMLIIGDGTLPDDEAQWLAHKNQASYRQALYRRISSTAITDLGSALHDSLRTREVTIPVQLQASLKLQISALESAHRDQQAQWLAQPNPWQPIRDVLALIDSVGGNRTRGLGEAIVTWVEGGQPA